MSEVSDFNTCFSSSSGFEKQVCRKKRRMPERCRFESGARCRTDALSDTLTLPNRRSEWCGFESGAKCRTTPYPTPTPYASDTLG